MPENHDIEYKREYTRDLRKEVVAFANSHGGTIYIGIEDDGTVTGVEDADSTILQVSNMLRDAIKPDVSLFTRCRIEEQQGKHTVVISVQRGTDRPYYIGEKGLKPSGVYVRLGNAAVPASDAAIRAMIKETDGDSFEDMRSLEQSLTFSYAQAEFEKRDLGFADTQKKNLGLINEDGLYTNLGLLLSDQCMHTTKVAVFQSPDKSDFRDRKEFAGSLLQQLAETFEYINIYNRTSAHFEGLLRIDRPDYPEVAIRETLLNAYVHREYSFSGSTLVNIFTDRIEIVSLGGLVPGLSIEAVKLGVSQSRNVKLANVFYRLKLIEAYGTGISKTISSYDGAHAQPDFQAREGAFLAVLPNINEPIAGAAEGIDTREQRIVAYIRQHGQLTRKETEELLGVGQSAAGNILRSMEAAGNIKKTGQGKLTTYTLGPTSEKV